MEKFKHKIDLGELLAGESQNVRLDRYLARVLGVSSRSQIKNQVVKALINGKESKLGKVVKPGDELEIFYAQPASAVALEDPTAEDIDLDILYEDDNVTVIDKAQGMVVHPAKGNYSGTLVNALLFHYRRIQENFPDLPLRPGIVHRLDKDTSGVMIVTKNTKAHECIALQFRNRAVRKTYIAIVKGQPPEPAGKIETQIIRDPRMRQRFTWSTEGGKKAVTFYRLLSSFSGYSLLSVRPHTGRTHQIRVHALSMGCPVLGDPIYSRRDRRFPGASLMLHSYRLGIQLPDAETSTREFRSPLPVRFKTILKEVSAE